MEKPPAKSKNRILKLLPRVARAAVSFQNLPFSPRRDKRPDQNAHGHKRHLHRGFSGPIVSMIPAEARGRSKSLETDDQEPISPKVSCMGQIRQKNKKRLRRKKQVSLPKEFRPGETEKAKSIRRKTKPSGRKSDASTMDHAKQSLPRGAPRLSQMSRFAGSRGTLADFDWTTTQAAPDEDREFYSDEDRGDRDHGKDDIIIPFSAPMLTSGGGGVAGMDLEPRKEINLWKRRTMAQPRPLQLNIHRAN